MPKRRANELFDVDELPSTKRWRPWRSRDDESQQIEESQANDNLTVSAQPQNAEPAGKIQPYYFDNVTIKSEIIPVFDPEKSDIFAHQWVSKIEQLSTIYNWSDAAKCYYMQSRLGGMARQWHSSLKNYDLSWSDWKQELLKAFPCNVDYAEALREMLTRKKHINESMAQYYYQKIAMLSKLDISGDKAVACVIDGLPIYLKAPARAGNYKTVTDLYSNFLAIMEDTKPKLTPMRFRNDAPKTTNDPPPSSSQSKDSRRGPVCFLCNDIGHTVRRCPKNQNRPTCTHCGKVGHVIEKCYFKLGKLEENRTNPTTSINYITSEVNNTYFMNVDINGTNVIAYFDSGAKINVASPEIARKLNLSLSPCDLAIGSFGGGHTKAKGAQEVDIIVNNIHFRTTLVITDWSLPGVQLILGQPIINDPRINFMVNGTTLRIENATENITPVTQLPEILLIEDIDTSECRIKVYCSETTVVPPRSTAAINVNLEDSKVDYDVFVECRSCCHEVRDYSIPSTLLSGSTGIINVRNNSHLPLLLEKGDLLARGDRCFEGNSEQNQRDLTLTDSSKDNILLINSENIRCDLEDPDIKLKLKSLLEEYADCFSSSTKELGCTDKIKMEIKLTSEKPVCYRPYRMSMPEKAIVRDKIQDLLENNIIRESNSPYSSPIILVKKKNGDYRLCVDFRKLNNVTVKDKYPLPIIEEQVEKLGGKQIFTSLDMSQGFYQIPLQKESIAKTGFITPEGHYEFLRMPFGLANSPSVYQRLMDKILGPLRFDNVLPYMDDLLIASNNEDEALNTLRTVLDIIRDAKLTLNLDKCRFLQKEIQYLGYDISSNGIRPGQKKIDAVTKFKEPSNVHELRMFLGLTSYFRKFVRSYAIIAHDLYKLLKKNEPWVWSQSHQDAFNTLKKILTTRPVLALYDHTAETEVHTDASSKGLAGILLQRSNNQMRPVAYFSRKTSREESVYHSYELEALAVVESLKRFRIYLAGIEFKVVTDCSAVRETFEKRDLLPRIARWWLSIQEYNFNVIHRPGSTHKHVDALSRTPLDEPNKSEVLVLDLLDWVVCIQNQDSKLQVIRDKLENHVNDPDVQNNYVLKDNKVYRKCTNNQLRLVVPKYSRWNIMRRYHDDIGHPGLKRCETLIKESLWFPKMTRFVRKYVNSCLDCAYKRGQYGKLEGQLHPIEKITEPLHTLHIDHAGPFCKSRKGSSYLFVVVDSFTKFVWAKACRTTKTAEVIEKLNEIFCMFGYPKRIISDSGTAFTSKTFKEFCVKNQIKHVKNAVASPRSNGQVERFNRTLIEAINKSTKEERDWDICLGKVTWGINNTINSTTGFTAYKLMFQASRSLLQGIVENTMETEQTARDNYDQAKRNIENKAVAMKKRFDSKRRKPTQYQVKDLVLWNKSEAATKDVRRKLKEKYSGPYKITKCLGNDRYIITALKGLKGYKKFSAVVASDVLRRFVNDTDSESDSNDSSVDSTEELIDLLEG